MDHEESRASLWPCLRGASHRRERPEAIGQEGRHVHAHVSCMYTYIYVVKRRAAVLACYIPACERPACMARRPLPTGSFPGRLLRSVTSETWERMPLKVLAGRLRRHMCIKLCTLAQTCAYGTGLCIALYRGACLGLEGARNSIGGAPAEDHRCGLGHQTHREGSACLYTCPYTRISACLYILL